MELSGNLADFALSDILQILALSRKTGIVLVENGSVQGRIVLENGRVVFASSSDQHRLEDRIVKQTGVQLERLQVIKQLALSEGNTWTYEDLIVESGLLKGEDVLAIVRDYIFGSVAKLVSIEKGCFGIALNEVEYQQVEEEMRLKEGVEVNEVLLEAAKIRDEEACYDLALPVIGTTISHDSIKANPSDNVLSPVLMSDQKEENGVNISLLCSFLSELRVLSYESEVILTVMRFCSEFANRGVLFSLNGQVLRGIGKFGVEWAGTTRDVEEAIRSLCIPIAEAGIFRDTVIMERPMIYSSEDDSWVKHLRNILGGRLTGLEAYLIPLSTSISGGVAYVVYGDNYPGGECLRYVDSVVAFINQASLIIEKIRLQKELELIRYTSSG
jgi:hypothetical protein